MEDPNYEEYTNSATKREWNQAKVQMGLPHPEQEHIFKFLSWANLHYYIREGAYFLNEERMKSRKVQMGLAQEQVFSSFFFFFEQTLELH